MSNKITKNVLTRLIREEYNKLLFEEMNIITTNEAKNRNMFGPVYHGTTNDNIEQILNQGFKIDYNLKRNQYLLQDYYNGIPAPCDHLGFGVYFTESKTIARNFSNKQTKPLRYKYYIDATNIERINFGSPRTMMKWWIDNGYNVELAKKALETYNDQYRVEATKQMTEHLKQRYDAVLFVGKGGNYRLLDGNQICVYDPNNIYLIDDSNVTGLVLQGKVVASHDIFSRETNINTVTDEYIYNVKSTPDVVKGTKGVITNKTPIPSGYIKWLKDNPKPENFEFTPQGLKHYNEKVSNVINGDGYYYTVKFSKGGTVNNLTSLDIK